MESKVELAVTALRNALLDWDPDVMKAIQVLELQSSGVAKLVDTLMVSGNVKNPEEIQISGLETAEFRGEFPVKQWLEWHIRKNSEVIFKIVRG